MGGTFRALQDRLAAFRSSGDPRIVLDPQALDEVGRLRASIGWSAFGPVPVDAAVRRELDGIVLAGAFLFTRCLELPDGYGLDELLQATELFVAAYPFAPGSVPEPMRGVCAGLSGSPPGIDHVAWHDEAIDLLDAGGRTRDRQSVDRAIDLLASAVLAARGDANQPDYLSHLGSAWLDRFKITGRLTDLDNSVTAHLRALATTVPNEEDQAGHLANYSATLLARFEQTGNAQDLDGAVAAGRAAAKLARAAQAHYALRSYARDQDQAAAIRLALSTSLSNLGAALLSSFEHCRSRADLDEAVNVDREAVGFARTRLAASGLQANLAQTLVERFVRFWQAADLKEALAAARAAVDATADGDPARGPGLVSLAFAHAARFAYSGDLRDLDQAISVGREAVAAAQEGHFGLGSCLSNLGSALRTRYTRLGDTQALDEAITMHRRAVQLGPVSRVSRRHFLSNLGNALRDRFDAAGNVADIEESIAVLSEALAAAHRGDSDRAGCVANLVSSLVMASERGGGRGALDRAIAALRQEAGNFSGAHPERHAYLAALGYAHRAQFDATGDDEALRDAINSFRRAADAMPDDHPRRAEYLAGLGSALRRRFERTTDRTVGGQAISASRSAAAIGTAPASMRALAARDWGQVAADMGDATEAMNGFAAAVKLLDAVAWRGLHRGDQERQLGRFGALACDGAAWAIQAGHPERAVELLEQGRGVLLAHSLDERARYYDLDRAAPDLAARLASIDQNLEHLPSADDPMKADDVIMARWRSDLTRQRDTLLQQIRELPGFADFLQAPAFADLRVAAARGPVVIINVSAYRCDALTLMTSGIRVTSLPDLTGADAVRHVSAFVDALLALQKPDLAKWRSAGKTVTETLDWLWDVVASPLLPDLDAACGAQTAGQRPHVWWCPTGPLTFLPLHAAGRHDGTGDTVLDRFISSYAPTLRLLRQMRQRTAPRTREPRPLIVALPATPGQSGLPWAGKEADSFVGRFPSAMQLRGSQATTEAVERALADCPQWAHFACHGVQNVSSPSAGHLLLHDGPLSIGEISRLRLNGAELAFLSACETFRGGAELADEAITLATAFQLAGYSHVIGTLWMISDKLAPDVADHFYEALTPLTQPDSPGINASNTAVALDSAVLALRQKRPSAPWLWAAYAHIGP